MKPEVFPSNYKISKGRKELETLGENLFPRQPLSNPDQCALQPVPILEFLSRKSLVGPILATFDGNQIIKKQSLMAAIRALEFNPLTEKLQSPQNVYPFYRGWGTDNAKGIEDLRPFFHEIQAWKEENQKESLSLVFFEPFIKSALRVIKLSLCVT